MKKFGLVFIQIILSLCCYSQPEWITFTSNQPTPPRIEVLESNSQTVRFRVEIYGMYKQDTTVDSIAYQRISVPQCGVWDITGFPEMPAIVKGIAIPSCDSIGISFQLTDSTVLNTYNIYPHPDYKIDTANGLTSVDEGFKKIDSVYSQNEWLPNYIYRFISTSYLRDQKILTVGAYPFKFNPFSHQLCIYTTFEVAIHFYNATNNVCANLGLFSNLAKKALLNYQSDSVHSPSPFPDGESGVIQWITLNNISQASDIVADYLIITDHKFFDPHSTNLQQFAEHRSFFSGFDIAIIDVQNILGLNFNYNNSFYEHEQKIRDFIKRVYEGHNAHHTYDYKLAFVLLLGDAVGHNGGVPASMDPMPTGVPVPGDPSSTYLCSNDYYYSCITQSPSNPNIWDYTGDLYIGRIAADNENDLFNATTKTIQYEDEYTFGTWRNNNVLCYGLDQELAPNLYQSFCVDFNNWLNNLYGPDYTTTVIAHGHTSPYWADRYVDYLNTTGANIVINYGHGDVQSWNAGGGKDYDVSLTLQYKMDHLNNFHKYPFVISKACYTGAYDLQGRDCMAEKMNLYSPIQGYLAYLGDYVKSGLYATLPGQFPKYLNEWIPYTIYHDLSTVLGECVLESRLQMQPFTNPWHFSYNLFGDPAVNLMAKGYEITHNVELPVNTTISTKVILRSGNTLTIPDNGTVIFTENGQLIIESGATLAVGQDVTIAGRNNVNNIQIVGCMTGIGGSITNPLPITNLSLNSYENAYWRGLEFANGNMQLLLNGGSISNCNLTGQLGGLDISNSFSGNNSKLDLKGCNLSIANSGFNQSSVNIYNNTIYRKKIQITQSHFDDTPLDNVISFSHYSDYLIENSVINYSKGTGINVAYSGGFKSGKYNIQNNIIQKYGSPQENSWGIIVYNSYANIINNLITNNLYGIATMNMSSVKILGNEAANNIQETQQIFDNFKNQVRCFDNSFPYEFHYNYINTSLSSNHLIYYDNSLPSPQPIRGLLNIKCNDLPQNPILFPQNFYAWIPTWSPPSSCQGDDDNNKLLYDLAQLDIDSSRYTSADSLLKYIITSDSKSVYSIEAAKKLIPLTLLANQGFQNLKSYYDTTTELHSDSIVEMLINHLKPTCDVYGQNYPSAINSLENEILNPISFDDSIYSIIDLEDTYIRMMTDNSKKNTSESFTGMLSEYRPASFNAYLVEKKNLIELLFHEKSIGDSSSHEMFNSNSDLFQMRIHPNPFSSEATLTYFLPNKCDLTIVISNILGRELLVLSKPKEDKGLYSININFESLTSGLYNIYLKTDGRIVSKIKGIKIEN
jgi:hypothetical protein